VAEGAARGTCLLLDRRGGTAPHALGEILSRLPDLKAIYLNVLDVGGRRLPRCAALSELPCVLVPGAGAWPSQAAEAGLAFFMARASQGGAQRGGEGGEALGDGAGR